MIFNTSFLSTCFRFQSDFQGTELPVYAILVICFLGGVTGPFLTVLCWVLLLCTGSQQVGATPQLQCPCFSLCWPLVLRSTGSRHADLSSRSTWAQQLWLVASRAWAHCLWFTAQPLRGMRNLPRPGIEPTSPAQAGRFLSIVPPGKYQCFVFDKTKKVFCFFKKIL